VPLIGDSATVTMTGPEQQAYAITWPRDTADQHHPRSSTALRTPITGQPTQEHAAYCGTFTLHFPSPPGEVQAVLARYAVDRATALVHSERLIDQADSARKRAANRDAALSGNREIGIAIGILMSGHKISKEDAIDVLRGVGRQTHRKLRDVALDIAEAGTIDLLADLAPPGPRDGAAAPGERSDPRPCTQRAS
jgi:ANTAR domain